MTYIAFSDGPAGNINETICTMEEILDKFAASEYKGRVEITSDSCYSGKLCYAA